MPIKFIVSIITILYVSLVTPISVAADWRSSKEFYIKLFGQEQQGDLIDNAHEVFNRVLPVINQAKNKTPELVVVNSKGWPWAIALPDNSVIVSQGALEVCYDGVDKSLGDTRLAMILGHELSHIAEDDYWYRDTYVALENDENIRDKTVFRFIAQRSGLTEKDKDWLTSVRDREIRADDRGFIYAALAGYDVKQLVSENDENFFQHWKRKTQLDGAQTHASASERAAFIKARFKQLSGLVDAYELGLVLLHFNYLDEAESIYRRILDRLPAAEVYNNLGHIYTLRSQYFGATDSQDLFWLPSLVDAAPRTKLLTRGRISKPVVDQEALDKAAELFKAALEHRPDYFQANINLASVYFMQEKYDAAVAVLKEMENHQEHPLVQSMKVISRYMSLQDTLDITEFAQEKLVSIMNEYPDLPYLTYNVALFLEMTNQSDAAKPYWEKMVSYDYVQNRYAKVVCEKVQNIQSCQDENNNKFAQQDEKLKQWFKQKEEKGELINDTHVIQGLVRKLEFTNHIEYLVSGLPVLTEVTLKSDDDLKAFSKDVTVYNDSQLELKTLSNNDSVFVVKDNKNLSQRAYVLSNFN